MDQRRKCSGNLGPKIVLIRFFTFFGTGSHLPLTIHKNIALWQKFSFLTKPQLPNLQQTIANTIPIINISNSNNINKF